LTFLIQIIQWVSTLLILLIILSSILSFVLPPYHQFRQTLDRIIEPMLRPIRQVLPQTGAVDFSPLVLLIIIYLLAALLTNLLLALG
jgi:YggT family protein